MASRGITIECYPGGRFEPRALSVGPDATPENVLVAAETAAMLRLGLSGRDVAVFRVKVYDREVFIELDLRAIDPPTWQAVAAWLRKTTMSAQLNIKNVQMLAVEGANA